LKTTITETKNIRIEEKISSIMIIMMKIETKFTILFN
jgi:hypothetical protein